MLELLNLLRILQDESVDVFLAADLELDSRSLLVTLDAGRGSILASANLNEVLDILDFARHLVGFRIDLSKSCGIGDLFFDVDAICKVLWEEFSKQISVACDKIKIRNMSGAVQGVAQACAAGDAVLEAAAAVSSW